MVTSNSTMTAINLMPISEKLVCANHTLWKAQILACGFLDGTNKAPATTIKIKTFIEKGTTENIEEVPNPAFDLWKA
jgi:hypothetical protein